MMMIVLRLLSLLDLKSQWHRHFSPQPLNKVFFQGWDVGGLVDSWPETLVPSASNRSTPEWTPVDSVDSRQGRFDEKQLRVRSSGSRRPSSRSCPASAPAGRESRRDRGSW